MAHQTPSGLDINLGNLCSKDAYGWAKRTFANRDKQAGATALNVDGAFSNMLIFGNQRIGITSDGIGTKIELAERTGIYHTLGFDLVAMVADDLATAGFEPTTISNIIDVDKLDRDIINDLMRGLHDAANFCNISISGGEIAELGNRINGWGDRMHFNWCSTAIGVLPEALAAPLDGSRVREGDVVIALRSPNFRSNGFSLVRRILQAAYGEQWHNERYDDAQTWGEVLLAPCVIYSPLITAIAKANLPISGAAHITGGGILENFDRVLKTNQLGAVIDTPFAPTEAMQRVMTMGNISNEQAYLYWNMGNGMLLTVPESSVDAVLTLAEAKNYEAKVAGRVIQGTTIHVHALNNEIVSRNYAE